MPIRRGDLVSTRSIKGTLDFGTQTAVAATLAGTITELAPVGTTVRRGGALFRIDDEPVVLAYGKRPMWRPLGPGARGRDVAQLESNLVALGYRTLTADESYTASTASTVRRWQRHLGVPDTGRVELGRIVYATGPLRIAAHLGGAGDRAPGPALAVTGTDRAVTLKLPAADQVLAKTGRAVTVGLPGGEVVAGRVSSVVRAPAGQGSGPEEALVTVSIADQAKVAKLDESGVDVRFMLDERKDVLTVPVTALLALREGGYGVELLDGAESRVVAVQVGLFADGQVEINGAGIVQGAQVVVPA
ncbi:peptidoglycan-binding protein [Micromonospora sp. NBC_00898]|uniref:peptidoglycan-binding protein n=1 Tax=Micromonospora sp. NBC_00898 TaxID=2975981 RepID=UPI00386BEC84|nr:peptidoglycan-binding protein [Micromonospora sp. NBC_00898]